MTLGPVARRLTELERLTIALSEVIKKDSLGKWLQAPNPAFRGSKSLEVIERGESDRPCRSGFAKSTMRRTLFLVKRITRPFVANGPSSKYTHLQSLKASFW